MMSGQTSPPGQAESAAAESAVVSAWNGGVAERLAYRRQRAFHHRMGRDGKDDQNEQGAQIAGADQHREARDTAARQHHAGPEQRAPQQRGGERQVGREKPVPLEGDQVHGNREAGAGNRARQRHYPGAQRRQAIAPLAHQTAAQAESAALRQRAVGAAQHQTQQHGRRERCQFLEPQLLEHGELPPPGRIAVRRTISQTSSTEVRNTDGGAVRPVLADG